MRHTNATGKRHVDMARPGTQFICLAIVQNYCSLYWYKVKRMHHTNATGKRHVEEPLNLLLNLLALLVQKYKFRRRSRRRRRQGSIYLLFLVQKYKRTNTDAIYLLYWHKSTNTDAKAAGGGAGRGGWHRATAHP
jgi:hypothetical protein